MHRTDDKPVELARPLPQADGIRVAPWFAVYGLLLAAAALTLAWQFQHAGVDLGHIKWAALARAFGDMDAWIKLLILLVYLSVCTTLLPLNTGWAVTALAMREAGLAQGVWATTLLVASVGAVGSTIANLNDYHLFTWLLRNGRVAKVRQTRLYERARRWFNSAPFFLLMLFNVLPLPVDVVRPLAITCRYPRWSYAASNFIGRFVRYAFLAFMTYYFDLGRKAPLALLGLAAVLVLGKALHSAYGKLHPAKAAG